MTEKDFEQNLERFRSELAAHKHGARLARTLPVRGRALIGGLAAALITVIAFVFFSGGENAPSTVTSVAAVGVTDEGVASANVQFYDPLPSAEGLPDIYVTSALVKELGAQQSIFSYRPRARWPIASITKLLTAVVAYEKMEPGFLVTISQTASETEGTAGDLRQGEKYSVNDLVKAMLTVSSNDAAVALAEAYDRRELGEEKFAKALNRTALFTTALSEKAQQLGMHDTYFGDVVGLSLINQAVVGDLAILMQYISVNHPEILEVTAKRETTILERNKLVRKKLVNINQFAGQKEFLGGKTGFTDDAGQNLVSLFSYNGKKYLIVVLGTEDRFGETEKLYQWLKQHLVSIAPAPITSKP